MVYAEYLRFNWLGRWLRSWWMHGGMDAGILIIPDDAVSSWISFLFSCVVLLSCYSYTVAGARGGARGGGWVGGGNKSINNHSAIIWRPSCFRGRCVALAASSTVHILCICHWFLWIGSVAIWCRIGATVWCWFDWILNWNFFEIGIFYPFLSASPRRIVRLQIEFKNRVFVIEKIYKRSFVANWTGFRLTFQIKFYNNNLVSYIRFNGAARRPNGRNQLHFFNDFFNHYQRA